MHYVAYGLVRSFVSSKAQRRSGAWKHNESANMCNGKCGDLIC